MPIVADYGIVSDAQFTIGPTGGGSQQFNFDLPDPPHEGSRSILMFNIDLEDADDFEFEVKINNASVFTATYNGGDFFTIHEVLPKGLLQHKQNWMLMWHKGGGKAHIGDIVLLYQHQI